MRAVVCLVGLLPLLATSCLLLTDTRGLSGGTSEAAVDQADAAGGDAAGGDAAGGDAAHADSQVPDANARLSYRAVVLADAPLGYWRLGDLTGAVARDEVGAHNGIYGAGVTVGAPGALVGDQDPAASFEPPGTVQIGDGFAFTGTSTFTVEAWIKPVANSIYAPVMSDDSKGDSGAPGAGWDLYVTPGGLLSFNRLFVDGTRVGVGTQSPVPTTRFTHVVVTYDGEQLVLYTDGVRIAAAAATAGLAALGSLFVIGAEVGGAAGTTHYRGVIDEVALYDHPLSPSRVTVHHEVGVQPL